LLFIVNKRAPADEAAMRPGLNSSSANMMHLSGGLKWDKFKRVLDGNTTTLRKQIPDDTAPLRTWVTLQRC